MTTDKKPSTLTMVPPTAILELDLRPLKDWSTIPLWDRFLTPKILTDILAGDQRITIGE